jgi:hypothetical protein
MKVPRNLVPPLALVLLLATACGSGGRSTGAQGTTTAAPPTTTAGTTETTAPPPARMSLTIFQVQGGELHAEETHPPHTRAVAAAALAALGVPAPVAISGGTATVSLDHVTPEQQAEVVYTLTQFASVKHVDVGGRRGLTRDDVAAFVPPILVESPADGATVPASFRVSGTASVFEATLVVELVRGGTVLERQTVTASEGAPSRGTFSTTLHARSSGPATVVAFSPSAENGEPQHEQRVPVTVSP